MIREVLQHISSFLDHILVLRNHGLEENEDGRSIDVWTNLVTGVD